MMKRLSSTWACDAICKVTFCQIMGFSCSECLPARASNVRSAHPSILHLSYALAGLSYVARFSIHLSPLVGRGEFSKGFFPAMWKTYLKFRSAYTSSRHLLLREHYPHAWYQNWWRFWSGYEYKRWQSDQLNFVTCDMRIAWIPKSGLRLNFFALYLLLSGCSLNDQHSVAANNSRSAETNLMLLCHTTAHT